MIERIMPSCGSEESPSAFCRGAHERPLRITFHTSSFIGSSGADAEALEALRQLAHLPDIEALETESGIFPHLEIGTSDDSDFYIPVLLKKEDVTIEAGLTSPDHWKQIAAQLAGQSDLQHIEAQAMFQDLIVARAHRELGQDILITLSPRLLTHRTDLPIRETNPRSPSEAVQIVGLFLRSRDNYTYFAGPQGRVAFDRGLFYWVLMRHSLTSMWFYFSACVEASKIRNDDTLYIGQSILSRCNRALEARDAIGIQFYLPQNNNTRDTMMYHFDYLTLLLAGAFDAQARIAHRVYRIQLKERDASFRRQDFLKALKKDNDVTTLYDLVTEQYFQDVMTLLYEPRNTIHGAGLPTLASKLGAEPEASFVTILPQYQTALWQAAERCGSPEHWGLTKIHGVQFEPYTYAVSLVKASLKLIDAIAAATNIAGLFPSGHAIPPLLDKPPENSPFSEANRKRLAILG